MQALKKETIIQHIYDSWKETSAENRYFTEENIQKCATDLDNFCAEMAQLQQTNAPQSAYEQAIYNICENLVTFGREDEEPECLHGFLYDIYTQELTDFIRETAFDYGFELPDAEIIKTNIFSLKHSAEFRYAYFSVYIGTDAENGVSLWYDSDEHSFEYEENPYGEGYPLPIYNFHFDDDLGEISFEVLSQGRYRHIKLVAQYPQDKVWLKALSDLHQNAVFPTFPDKAPIDFCDIDIETERGTITRLKTMNKDSEGNIISMYHQGAGITIFTSEINEKGELQSEHQLNKLKAVDKKLFFVHAVPEWKCFEVDLIAFKGNLFEVTTKNNYRWRDENQQLQTITCSAQTFVYQLKTFDFMLDFLKELLNNTKP